MQVGLFAAAFWILQSSYRREILSDFGFHSAQGSCGNKPFYLDLQKCRVHVQILEEKLEKFWSLQLKKEGRHPGWSQPKKSIMEKGDTMLSSPHPKEFRKYVISEGLMAKAARVLVWTCLVTCPWEREPLGIPVTGAGFGKAVLAMTGRLGTSLLPVWPAGCPVLRKEPEMDRSACPVLRREPELGQSGCPAARIELMVVPENNCVVLFPPIAFQDQGSESTWNFGSFVWIWTMKVCDQPVSMYLWQVFHVSRAFSMLSPPKRLCGFEAFPGSARKDYSGVGSFDLSPFAFSASQKPLAPLWVTV